MTKVKSKYPEYKHYRTMIRNCYQKAINYYQENDIRVHDAWLGEDGFWVFLKDVGTKPSEHHKLFRKDTTQGYKPGNTVWSLTPPVQPKQTKKQKPKEYPITYKDKEYTIADFCKNFNLKYHRTYARIKRGWNIEDVINEPNQFKNPTRCYLNKFRPEYMMYQRLLLRGNQEEIDKFLKRMKSVKGVS